MKCEEVLMIDGSSQSHWLPWLIVSQHTWHPAPVGRTMRQWVFDCFELHQDLDGSKRFGVSYTYSPFSLGLRISRRCHAWACVPRTLFSWQSHESRSRGRILPFLPSTQDWKQKWNHWWYSKESDAPPPEEVVIYYMTTSLSSKSSPGKGRPPRRLLSLAYQNDFVIITFTD